MNSDSILSTIRTLESRLEEVRAEIRFRTTIGAGKREVYKQQATIQIHIENAYRALRLFEEAEAIMSEIPKGD